MKNRYTGASKIFLATGAIIGWFAIIFQLYLIIINRTAPIAETIIRFFSFFTILTNILVALCFIILLLKPNSVWGNFYARPTTLTALTLYIAVVGLVYNMVLRFLWAPQGLQAIVDELLHSVIPLMFVVHWIIYVTKENLTWRNIFAWLIYPTIYCVYSLIRGEIVGFYPYPFIDVNVIGYKKVFVNIGYLMIVFLMLSLLLIGIAKLISKSPAKKYL